MTPTRRFDSDLGRNHPDSMTLVASFGPSSGPVFSATTEDERTSAATIADWLIERALDGDLDATQVIIDAVGDCIDAH